MLYYDSSSKVIKLNDGNSWFTVGTSTSGMSLSGNRVQLSDLDNQYMTIGTTTQQGFSVLTVEATSTAAIPLTIVARSGQTANLLQIINESGTELFAIDANGNASTSAITIGGALYVTGDISLATASSTGTVKFSSINSDTGEISFDDENLTTSGTFAAGATTITGGITATTDSGIGSSTPTWQLSITDTASQLALAYDDNGYALFDVNTADDLTITATGGEIDFGDENLSTTGTLGAATTTISNGDLIVDTDTLYVDNDNDKVGVGTSTPGSVLDIYSTATTTLTIDNDSGDKGSCLKLRDGGGAWVYCWIATGGTSWTCNTTACDE